MHRYFNLPLGANRSSQSKVDEKCLDLMKRIRSCKPYLTRRLKEIEGKFMNDDVEDIQYWLDIADDVRADLTFGQETLEVVLQNIMEMRRLHPIENEFSPDPVQGTEKVEKNDKNELPLENVDAPPEKQQSSNNIQLNEDWTVNDGDSNNVPRGNLNTENIPKSMGRGRGQPKIFPPASPDPVVGNSNGLNSHPQQQPWGDDINWLRAYGNQQQHSPSTFVTPRDHHYMQPSNNIQQHQFNPTPSSFPPQRPMTQQFNQMNLTNNQHNPQFDDNFPTMDDNHYPHQEMFRPTPNVIRNPVPDLNQFPQRAQQYFAHKRAFFRPRGHPSSRARPFHRPAPTISNSNLATNQIPAHVPSYRRGRGGFFGQRRVPPPQQAEVDNSSTCSQTTAPEVNNRKREGLQKKSSLTLKKIAARVKGALTGREKPKTSKLQELRKNMQKKSFIKLGTREKNVIEESDNEEESPPPPSRKDKLVADPKKKKKQPATKLTPSSAKGRGSKVVKSFRGKTKKNTQHLKSNDLSAEVDILLRIFISQNVDADEETLDEFYKNPEAMKDMKVKILSMMSPDESPSTIEKIVTEGEEFQERGQRAVSPNGDAADSDDDPLSSRSPTKSSLALQLRDGLLKLLPAEAIAQATAQLREEGNKKNRKRKASPTKNSVKKRINVTPGPSKGRKTGVTQRIIYSSSSEEENEQDNDKDEDYQIDYNYQGQRRRATRSATGGVVEEPEISPRSTFPHHSAFHEGMPNQIHQPVIYINAHLGKVKIEQDYNPPSEIKTEPVESEENASGIDNIDNVLDFLELQMDIS